MSRISPPGKWEPICRSIDDHPRRREIMSRLKQIARDPSNNNVYNHVLLQQAIDFVEKAIQQKEALRRMEDANRDYEEILAAQDLIQQ